MQGRTKGKNGADEWKERVGWLGNERDRGREGEGEGERERKRRREKDALTCRSGNEIELTQLARRVNGGRQSRQAATIERESEKLVNPINQ